ncbi:MAG: prolipoprotein diacylglyceryl transferase [Solirubrobacteraceae bacterium]
MSYILSEITVGIGPTIEVGPFTLAWHGLTIAAGIAMGTLVGGRDARRRGLDRDPAYVMAGIVALAALVGGRLFYLAEHGKLDEPGRWLAASGFTFYGGVIAATIALPVYLRTQRLSPRYLDAAAVGLPLGVAVGRVGDIINGEHYGEATDFFLGVRNPHPDALVPSPDIAYHSGGLYESLLGLAIFVLAWPLRKRLDRPLAMVWLVLGLFGLGRFFVFFARSDDELALGLSTGQWASLALVAIAIAGASLRRRAETTEPPPHAGAKRARRTHSDPIDEPKLGTQSEARHARAPKAIPACPGRMSREIRL